MRKPACAHDAFMSGSFVAMLTSLPMRSVRSSLAVCFTSSTLPHGSTMAPGANDMPAMAALVWQSSGMARPAKSPSTIAAPTCTAASMGVAVLPAPSSKGTMAATFLPV